MGQLYFRRKGHVKRVIIRLETKDEEREVEALTRDACWNVCRPGCVEHSILHAFRGRPEFVPEPQRQGYGTMLLRRSMDAAGRWPAAGENEVPRAERNGRIWRVLLFRNSSLCI